jgi:hypothetical protein
MFSLLAGSFPAFLLLRFCCFDFFEPPLLSFGVDFSTTGLSFFMNVIQSCPRSAFELIHVVSTVIRTGLGHARHLMVPLSIFL